MVASQALGAHVRRNRGPADPPAYGFPHAAIARSGLATTCNRSPKLSSRSSTSGPNGIPIFVPAAKAQPGNLKNLGGSIGFGKPRDARWLQENDLQHPACQKHRPGHSEPNCNAPEQKLQPALPFAQITGNSEGVRGARRLQRECALLRWPVRCGASPTQNG